MMIFAIVTPILLVLGLLTIMMTVKNMGRIQIKKNVHRKLIIGYLILLFIGVITAEIMTSMNDQEPPPKMPENAAQFDLRSAIEQDAAIPERLVAARRTHEVDGTFAIPDLYNGAYILIERTPGESNIIEETVFKPELYAGFDVSDGSYFDLTGQLQIELPVWDSRSMRIPKQPVNKIRYSIYHDSNMLTQFGSSPSTSTGMVSGTVSGMMTIHLRIPESIELDISETEDEFEYDQYIELL
ncbi:MULTISPECIES: hypothetical protein [unclassified Sporosarcina]|uniref:hypothetical protein n=1 Tax=unclassified Sporosarcina TaxID=2647733 RepID=UPI00203A9FB6|nr:MULTISPECIES: hypothetical protein [unclassified Sporosarcina]GKV63989.1 hypothetical protein NCCP2331_01420 [Sporosarcina sp. NCCP-2331]GLB54770.1 hypothetical protein NCCP2378_05550 [Sporosarcina sp. NCCP-2378]